MADDDSIPRKRCTKCKQEKARDEFHRNRAKHDGLSTECKPCAKAKAKAVYAADPEGHRERMRAAYRRRPDEYKERALAWGRANPERRRDFAAAAKARDPERVLDYGRRDWAKHNERRRATKKAYRAANPERGAEHVRARQTRKQQAMPAWADRNAIRAIYAECRRVSDVTGVKHHVDHFYPLKGATVSGLHNEFNLRIVPAFVNQSKANKVPDA